MTPDAHRRALQAAAKLAAVSLTACSGTQAAPPNAEAPAAPKESANVQPSAVLTPVDTAPSAAPAAPARDDAKPSKTEADPAALQACKADIDKAIKEGALGRSPQKVDDKIIQCCLTVSRDAGNKGKMMAGHPCCAAINFETVACTPWGPPVPPCMPKVLQQLA